MSKKKNTGYWIKTAICLFLLFGLGHFPPIAGLSPLGMRVFATFVGMLFGWTTLGFIWPSILAIISLGLTGFASTSALISMGMGSVNITLFILFILIFANYIDDIGLSTVIANWFISRKIAVGRPWVFTTMLLLCVFCLSAVISLYASIFLMWNIFYSICKTVGYKPFDKYPMIVLTGLVFAAGLGYTVFPFRTMPLLALNALEMASGGLTVNALQFSLLCGILGLASLFAYLLVCRFLFRPDVTPLLKAGDPFADLRHQVLDKRQKIGLGFTVLFFLMLLGPSIMPKDTLIGGFLQSLGMSGSTLLILGILSIIRVDGKPAFEFQRAASHMNWTLIVMFMATVPVSNALSSPEVGVMDAVIELIGPVFMSMPPMVFAVAFIAAMGILTQFTQNVVLAVLFPPILYHFCVAMGCDPLLMITLFTFAISAAMATPSASATAAIVFANTEWIDVRSAYKYCITAAVLSILVNVILGFSVGAFIF